ncbi:DUF2378 family protein [Thermodesulfobacteriota bacterium]
MGKVKGSIFIPWVKGVRGDKSGECDKYLTDEDREIISGHVLASSWYPFETYLNCVNAVANVVAKDDMEKIRAWGRDFVDMAYKGIYKNLFSEKDPRRAMKSRQLMFKTLYDFVTAELEEISENEYVVTFRGTGPEFKAVYYSWVGVMERGLELSGAEGLKAEFIEKDWNGSPKTRVRFTWSGWASD